MDHQQAAQLQTNIAKTLTTDNLSMELLIREIEAAMSRVSSQEVSNYYQSKEENKQAESRLSN